MLLPLQEPFILTLLKSDFLSRRLVGVILGAGKTEGAASHGLAAGDDAEEHK